MGMRVHGRLCSSPSVNIKHRSRSQSLLTRRSDVVANCSEFKEPSWPVSLRVARVRFAGSDAGAIVVSVEMPDLSTLAKVDELQRSNPEIAAVIATIGGLRKIMSDSLYEEISEPR